MINTIKLLVQWVGDVCGDGGMITSPRYTKTYLGFSTPLAESDLQFLALLAEQIRQKYYPHSKQRFIESGGEIICNIKRD